MEELRNLTGYFRQSLIDAERTCPDDKDVLPVLGPDKKPKKGAHYETLEHESWLTGCIPEEQAKAIIEAWQESNQKTSDQVELVMFPRVDLLRYRGGEHHRGKRRVLLPLVVFVRLTSKGQLEPSDKAPWIPREWLSPNQSGVESIADVVTVDDFLTQHPFEGIETWSELVSYCTRMLCWITGVEYIPWGKGQPGTSIFELDIHTDYELCPQSLLQVLDLPIVGAKEKMFRVLDKLGEKEELPPLYRSYINWNSPPLLPNQNLEFESDSACQHLGQMTGEFPLSPKQRNALHHFLKQSAGEMLAVNGPPGTGKTTLLRSVVANLWVQAALDENEPPLIVASSNNNQAVTNILESFARVDESGLDESLVGRWLPEVESYGLYCCAKRIAKENNAYLCHGPDGSGCMQRWQTREYVESASERFMQHASQWMDTKVSDVEEVKKALLREMKKSREELKAGVKLLNDFRDVEDTVTLAFESIESLQEHLEKKREQQNAAEREHAQLKSRLDQVYGLWEQRSLWVRLLSLLPLIGPNLRKQEYRKTARLLNQWDLVLEDHSDAFVERWFQQQLGSTRETLKELARTFAELQQLLERYWEFRQALESWIARHQPETLFTSTFPDQVSEVNDRVLRFRLFKLATHYWEARWLLEVRDFLESNGEDRKSPWKVLRKLRRFAKLTPCFVSTFYMTPSTFLAGEFQDQVWVDIPLFSQIDLLIVDEAGQALPEVSAASFSLAKRALVVGDTDQIEPVWSVPASVDRANLKLYNLLSDERSYDEFWLRSGLLASSGNVMRIAQRQCHYHQFPELQRGLYLTEHRRCYDNIIGYCNDLVYEGVLEPLRGEPKTEMRWETLSMVPVEEPSKSYGGSRGNPGEARKIVEWLNSEYDNILRYARQSDAKLREMSDEEVMEASVGIITPFSKQAALIRGELHAQGIRGLTVGTVHSLQGDERLLVLFSSVYGINDKAAGKFYDRGSNMLNVAVSRAKDAFIVFGHPNVFGMDSAASSSGLLRQKLSEEQSTAQMA